MLFRSVNKDPEGNLDPAVGEFLKFINSRQGQETVARAKLYPLTPAQTSENLELLGWKVLTAQGQDR